MRPRSGPQKRSSSCPAAALHLFHALRAKRIFPPLHTFGAAKGSRVFKKMRYRDKSSRREPHSAPGVLDLLVDGRQHTGQTSSVRHSQRPVRPCRVPFRPREGKKIRAYPLAGMRSDFVLRWCLWDSNPYVHGTADFPATLCRHSRAGRCGLDYLFTVAVWP